MGSRGRRRRYDRVVAQRQSRLTAADELALANAAANAALEGHDIPEPDRTLARSYLAGDLDHDTYRRRAHELIVEDPRGDHGLDA